MNEEALFEAALQLPGASERAAFLDQACGADAALRERLRMLLGNDDRTSGILDRRAEELSFVATQDLGLAGDQVPLGEGPGTTIGPYKLKEKIGEGGFGLVFVAEQQHPVRRKVALKILKPGMDTADVVARFEAERQALALMEHPHIAQVFDAGATATGRPYFVMELVRGLAITSLCDERRLGLRERLELFVNVCHAVQHAHQKGIIHRDLKPSNVLVTLHDGKPVPKVIDFGIAKALQQQLTDKSIYTRFVQFMGTPLYVSPEQAEMSGLDVDTRSDVYSLGVILYELLTGTTPFDGARLRAAGYEEMRRIIREEEPAKPSSRIAETWHVRDGANTTVAGMARGAGTARGTLRGQRFYELDWIVMKALEKDRTRRYATVSDLARDVERYLAHEPIEASPPSRTYRVRKFLRRHRGPVVAASLLLLTLVGGILGTTIGLVRAEHAWQAEKLRAEGEREAKDVAEKRLAQVEKGIDVLGGIFENLDPRAEEKEGRPLRAILGERLDSAAAELAGAVGDPLVVARLQERLGLTYLGLGHADKAEELLARSRATREVMLGANHPATLTSIHNQALACRTAGKYEQAATLLQHARDGHVQALGPEHRLTLIAQANLGWTYRIMGRVDEGIALLEQVRDVQVKNLGPEHPETIGTLNDLAGAYVGAKRAPEAIELLKQVRAARVRQHGEQHPESLAALNNLAMAHQAAYQMRLTLELLEQARDQVVPVLGEDHPQSLKTLNNLAWSYRAFGRTAEAIKLGERVRARQVLQLGGHHPNTIHTTYNLALAYQADGKSEQAMTLFQQAAVGVEKLQFVHDMADRVLHQVCQGHERLNQHDQAESWRRKWLAAVRAREGPASAAHGAALLALGANLSQQGKHADAETFLREALAIAQKSQPEAATTFRAQLLLGAALMGQQRYADAEPHLVQAQQELARLESKPRPTHGGSTSDDLTEVLQQLVQLYDAWGKQDQADEWRVKLAARKRG